MSYTYQTHSRCILEALASLKTLRASNPRVTLHIYRYISNVGVHITSRTIQEEAKVASFCTCDIFTIKNHHKQKFWNRFGIAFFSSFIIAIVIRVFVAKESESFPYKCGYFYFAIVQVNKSCKKLHLFMLLASFYTPWKLQRTSDFMFFLVGVKRDQWHGMV